MKNLRRSILPRAKVLDSSSQAPRNDIGRFILLGTLNSRETRESSEGQVERGRLTGRMGVAPTTE